MKKWLKYLKYATMIIFFLLIIFGIIAIIVSVMIRSAAGQLYDAQTYAEYEKLDNFKNGSFINYEPIVHYLQPRKRGLKLMFRIIAGRPNGPEYKFPINELTNDDFKKVNDDLKVYWLGHSMLVFEIEGTRVITDPVFDNAGPLPRITSRFQSPALKRKHFPKVDAVLISHDHYDHLEKATIKHLKNSDVKFITHLGVGARLIGWGIEPERITELNWGDSVKIKNLTITSQTSRHFSGRHLDDREKTLWGAFVIAGENRRVFFAGDGGYGKHFKQIGDDFGPFDLTCLEIGAWNKAWPNSHLFPEETVQAHIDLKGKYLMPMHWAVFDLSFHQWYEPIQRFIAAADDAKIDYIIPMQGEGTTPNTHKNKTWWLK